MSAFRGLAALLLVAIGNLAPAQAKAAPVNEEMFVSIGGIEQWITIKGTDRSNPVVLFLHGGPGDALSPVADSFFAGWRKDFTLVQWDQRGAGRTFGKTGPSIEPTMTMDRMTKDGIEVTEYLTHHLGKTKVILTGGSWGSVLGIRMVRARPDLFYAYVGQAQVVNWQKNIRASYEDVLRLAEAAKDTQTVDSLKSIGRPPWKTALPQWRIYRNAKDAYQAKLMTGPNNLPPLNPAYGSVAERKQYAEADDFSFAHFFIGRQPKSQQELASLPLAGEFTEVDLPSLGTNFPIPIYIVQGSADLTAPPELAKAYLDSIKAPRKQFYLVPGAGHEPNSASMNVVHMILMTQVRPIAK